MQFRAAEGGHILSGRAGGEEKPARRAEADVRALKLFPNPMHSLTIGDPGHRLSAAEEMAQGITLKDGINAPGSCGHVIQLYSMAMGTSVSPIRRSEAITRGYRVAVEPRYLSDESDPHMRKYVFAYRITITNADGVPAQLMSRRWRIVDAHGRESEVVGDGVVGATPHFSPGDVFEYESYCPLPTAWGTMEGSYTMQDATGERFDIAVPRFYLVCREGPNS